MVTRIIKLTGVELCQLACESTHRGVKSKITLGRIYRCEHSPIRTQLFWIEMELKTFVSVHFVRHKIGVEHYVISKRDDISGEKGKEVNRLTPVKHSILINAQSLINMARMRLCKKAHPDTIDAMKKIVEAVRVVDNALAKFMVPNCEYRGKCPEIVSCK